MATQLQAPAPGAAGSGRSSEDGRSSRDHHPEHQPHTSAAPLAFEDEAPDARRRGRTAERPEEIPARGWWDIVWRVTQRLASDNVTLVAGGLAMYTLLSVFPGLAAAVSLYGMFATPADVIQHMKVFSGVLPPGTWEIFNAELLSLTHHSQTTLSIAAAVGLTMALWSARSAMSALMTAANIAYGEHEKRGFFRQVLVSLALTVAAIVGFLLMLLLGVVIPIVFKILGTRWGLQVAADTLQWVLLWCFTVLGLAVVYRYAPAREHARWRWVTWGSAIAASLWLAMSGVFAFYVGSFAGYGKTYGALGGVVVLLMWFYLSSLLVLLGAEINAEMERQTVKDTTTGAPLPLGQRGAYAADTVGPSAGERPKTRGRSPVGR
jgi:membrane protein